MDLNSIFIVQCLRAGLVPEYGIIKYGIIIIIIINNNWLVTRNLVTGFMDLHNDYYCQIMINRCLKYLRYNYRRQFFFTTIVNTSNRDNSKHTIKITFNQNWYNRQIAWEVKSLWIRNVVNLMDHFLMNTFVFLWDYYHKNRRTNSRWKLSFNRHFCEVTRGKHRDPCYMTTLRSGKHSKDVVVFYEVYIYPTSSGFQSNRASLT